MWSVWSPFTLLNTDICFLWQVGRIIFVCYSITFSVLKQSKYGHETIKLWTLLKRSMPEMTIKVTVLLCQNTYFNDSCKMLKNWTKKHLSSETWHDVKGESTHQYVVIDPKCQIVHISKLKRKLFHFPFFWWSLIKATVLNLGDGLRRLPFLKQRCNTSP